MEGVGIGSVKPDQSGGPWQVMSTRFALKSPLRSHRLPWPLIFSAARSVWVLWAWYIDLHASAASQRHFLARAAYSQRRRPGPRHCRRGAGFCPRGLRQPRRRHCHCRRCPHQRDQRRCPKTAFFDGLRKRGGPTLGQGSPPL